MAATLRPFGVGPYGTGPWPARNTREIAGAAFVAFSTSGAMIYTWAQPTQMCAPGTWTKTQAPFPVAETVP